MSDFDTHQGNYYDVRVRVDNFKPWNAGANAYADLTGNLAPYISFAAKEHFNQATDLPAAGDVTFVEQGTNYYVFEFTFANPQPATPIVGNVKPEFAVVLTNHRTTRNQDVTINLRPAPGATTAVWNATEALFTTNGKDRTLFTVGAGEVRVSIRDRKHITRGFHWNDIGELQFEELRANAWQAGGEIRLDLPRGFHWDQNIATVDVVNPDSARRGVNVLTMDVRYATPTGEGTTNQRRAILPLPAGFLEGDRTSLWAVEGLRIMADRQTASTGDVVVAVSTNDANLVKFVPTELTVAHYGMEDVEISRVGDVKTIYAGRYQELNDVRIQETIWGAIGTNRTVEFVLPEGVKWHYNGNSNFLNNANDDEPKLHEDSEAEGLTFIGGNNDISWYIADRSRQRIVATVNNESWNQDQRPNPTAGGTRVGADLIFENLLVAVDTQFRGELAVDVEVGGWSKEGLVLGNVVPAVEVTMTEVAPTQLGFRSQPIGDIIIEEYAPGAIRRPIAYANSVITLTLEGDTLSRHKFTETPTAEVQFAGDDIRDSVQIEKVWMNPSRDQINIQIEDRGVNAASTIVISGLELTIDRTAPEGQIEMFVGGGSIIDAVPNPRQATGGSGRADLNINSPQYFLNSTYLARFDLAEVITPADKTIIPETVEFTVGQNTYTVGGRTVTMDTAPYNKDGRVMLPARFVANALGISDANVVWDQASQTVSVFVRDWTAQMTVGSNVAHGRQTLMMDVAPENINGRVFVPMRFLANLMGVDNDDISWDQASQTVRFY